MSIESQLPADLQAPVAERLQAAAGEQVARRIWERDGTLWAPEGTPELDRPPRLAGHRRADGRRGRRPAGVRRGGARRRHHRRRAARHGRLEPRRPRCSAAPSATGAMRLHVLDSTHPDQIRAVRDAVDLEKTLFIVSSKSGGTIETMSQFKYFHSLQGDGAHYVAVTDPGTSLARARAPSTASAACSRTTPTSAGATPCCPTSGSSRPRSPGSTSARCSHGAWRRWRPASATRTTRACELGAALGELALGGRDKLTFVVDEPLESFGLWAEQLVAESTGKEGRGILPIADEPLVDRRQLRRRPRVPARRRGRRRARPAGSAELRAAGHPVFTARRRRARPTSGASSSCREFATAVAGWVLGHQPVRPAQRAGGQGQHQARARRRRSPELDPGDVEALLGGARAAALPGDHGLPAVLGRRSRRAPRGCASGSSPTTTWRPPSATGRASCTRRASSTRAGPAVGAFLQIVDDPLEDLEVPGEPYTFGTLIRAQADGDLQTLRSHGLDAVRAGKEIL